MRQHTTPLVALVGRYGEGADSVRGPVFASGRRYSEALVRARSIPLVVAPIPELIDSIPDLIERVDGFVLHGGGDVDPVRYGRPPTTDELMGVLAAHDDFELAFVRAVLDADKPLLAICRGMQVLNVALGGTLVQHLGTHHSFATHTIHVEDGSRVDAAMGTTLPPSCHCVHHQALDRVAQGLRVVARSDDGIVHAVEVEAKRWAVATQWHPEDTAETEPAQQGLFNELVRQALLA